MLKTCEGLRAGRRVLLDVGRSFDLTPFQQFRLIQFPAALPTVFSGVRIGLINALITVVGIEFLIGYGGLGALIPDLADRFEIPAMYGAIVFVILVSACSAARRSAAREMVEAGLSAAMPLASRRLPAWRLQFVTLLAIWALVGGDCRFGPLLRRRRAFVLPVVAALARLIADPQFWFNLSVTGMEIGVAFAIGGGAGLLFGLLLGGNRFLGAAFEPYLAALAATPKIIILPIVYLMFGVGPASKIAIGAFACFVPVALSAASGMRQINPVLVRVGRSLDLSRWQMVHKIYLPALVQPVAIGLRIALGAAIAVCLIAEIKFSRIGLGAMVIDSFNRSRFAEVYAVLIVIISIAIAGNVLVNRFGRARIHSRAG